MGSKIVFIIHDDYYFEMPTKTFTADFSDIERRVLASLVDESTTVEEAEEMLRLVNESFPRLYSFAPKSLRSKLGDRQSWISANSGRFYPISFDKIKESSEDRGESVRHSSQEATSEPEVREDLDRIFSAGPRPSVLRTVPPTHTSQLGSTYNESSTTVDKMEQKRGTGDRGNSIKPRSRFNS